MKKIKISIVGIVAIAAIIVVALSTQNNTDPVQPLPQFTFDSQVHLNWQGSKNVNVQAVARSTNYTGAEPIEQLPVADLTIHHGMSGRAASDSCFLMYSYYDYLPGDMEALYDQYAARKKADGTLKAYEPIDQTIATFEGELSYKLQQYDYSVASADALRGYQIGFVALPSGYIRTEGVCKTYEDLARTLPLLASVQLQMP